MKKRMVKRDRTRLGKEGFWIGILVLLLIIIFGIMFVRLTGRVVEEQGGLEIQSTPGNIASCQKLDTAGVYTMTRNLNDSDVNLTGCFNITASNVELNCNGYFIRNTTLGVVGIYAGSATGLTNITIRNCNVTMGLSSPYLVYGIQFSYVNNSFITNNTANSNFRGLVLFNSSNNQIINNTANSNRYGIYLSLSLNNTISGNTANYNYEPTTIFSGVYLEMSSNNNIYNNNLSFNYISGTSWGAGAIKFFAQSNNNQIFNNILNSNSAVFYLASSSNNTFNNNVWNCTDTGYGCVSLSSSSNNTFIGIINKSSSNLIYMESNSSNNIFKDMIFLDSIKNDTYLTSINGFPDFGPCINNTFINVSYNLSKEYVESRSQLIRKWYLDLNTTNGTNALSSANISVRNRTNSLQFSLLTNNSGQIAQQQLIEYVNNGAANGINRTYYSNYTINTTKTDYTSSSVSFNLTTNSFFNISLFSTYLLPGNINSCGTMGYEGVYTMTRNLNESDVNSTGCFNITTSNVELNCNGFFIRNTSLDKSGIYAGERIVNVTVKNCNVSMNNESGSGIKFNLVNNSFIFNNTANSNEYGIQVVSSSNNQVINNIANLNQFSGIIFSLNSSNNTLIRNNANSNGYGIWIIMGSNNNTLIENTANSNRGEGFGVGIFIFFSSSNNTLINNTINSNSIGGMFISLSSNDNLFINNTINSNSIVGIFMDSSSSNILTNNLIWNNTNFSLFLQTSQNNTILGGIINSSAVNLIFVGNNSNNNIFRDLTLIDSGNSDINLTFNSLNNTFLNVSYNSSKEYVEVGSELIKKWYLDVNANDGTNNLLNANVSVWNVSNYLQFSKLSGSDGMIIRQELIEYINNGAVNGINRTYYSNYTINGSKIGYANASANFNLTINTNVLMIFNDLTSVVTLTPNTPSGGSGGGSFAIKKNNLSLNNISGNTNVNKNGANSNSGSFNSNDLDQNSSIEGYRQTGSGNEMPFGVGILETIKNNWKVYFMFTIAFIVIIFVLIYLLVRIRNRLVKVEKR